MGKKQKIKGFLVMRNKSVGKAAYVRNVQCNLTPVNTNIPFRKAVSKRKQEK